MGRKSYFSLAATKRRPKQARSHKGPLEGDIQEQLYNHYEARKRPNTVMFHVPNEGKRSKALGAAMKRQGLIAGVSDNVVVVEGVPGFLELKTEERRNHKGGGLTDAQSGFLEDAEKAGARVAVAYGLDEALVILERWGAIKPDRSGR